MVEGAICNQTIVEGGICIFPLMKLISKEEMNGQKRKRNEWEWGPDLSIRCLSLSKKLWLSSWALTSLWSKLLLSCNPSLLISTSLWSQQASSQTSNSRKFLNSSPFKRFFIIVLCLLKRWVWENLHVCLPPQWWTPYPETTHLAAPTLHYWWILINSWKIRSKVSIFIVI